MFTWEVEEMSSVESYLVYGGSARSPSGSQNLAVLSKQHYNDKIIAIFFAANKYKDFAQVALASSNI